MSNGQKNVPRRSEAYRFEMAIEATYEVVSLSNGDAQLMIHVAINGTPSGSLCVLSGPSADVEEFVRGAIGYEEILRRWKMSTAPSESNGTEQSK